MNKNTALCYALIMLECRLSLEDASKIFGVDMTELKESFNAKNIGLPYCSALDYLSHEIANYSSENKRGIFKANLYIRKYRRILKNSNKEERKKELEELFLDLMGPDISFAIDKCTYYTPEEKERILKYRLKFAKNNSEMKAAFHMNHIALQKWEDELPEGELKERLGIYREYTKSKYFARLRKKGKKNV